MNNRWFTSIALASSGFMAACLVAASTPESEPQEARKPITLAVVNIRECFKKDRYGRMKHVYEKIKVLRLEYAEELRAFDEKMSGFKDLLADEPTGTVRSRELHDQYRRAKAELKNRREFNQQRLREESAVLVAAAYNEIRRMVNLVGEEEGYDLILRVEEPKIDGDDPTTVNQKISSRVVLYQNPTCDITDKVLKRLNQEWAKNNF